MIKTLAKVSYLHKTWFYFSKFQYTVQYFNRNLAKGYFRNLNQQIPLKVLKELQF
jgi:hypothetical protein